MSNTVARVLRARVRETPDEPLIKCGGPWLTARQVDDTSAAVAAALYDLGVRRGDRVLIMLPNRQEMIEIFFACARSGAIQVPVNVYLKGEFLAYQLRDSQCRVAITDRAGLETLAPLIADTNLTHIVLVDALTASDGKLTVPVLAYAPLRETLGHAPEPEASGGDLVSILYTSGTTGPSKGCMLSNTYYTAPPRSFRDHGWLTDDDRILTPFQLFHGAAHAILMKGITARNGSVCFETSFSASTLMKRAQEESATLLWLLPPMAMAILAQDSAPIDSGAQPLRLTVCPGLPLPAQLEFEQRFGGRVAAEMYGQTESLGVVFGSLDDERRPGTLGRPGPHVDVRLVDDNDNDVPVGDIGEIVVRAKIPNCIYSGYWNQPEATASAMRDSWHHTGDLATADGDGVLSFVDRKKDSLRRRGENVSSFELESAISAFSKVQRCAVSAVPSPLGEDDIKASIVLKPGLTTTSEELFEYFRSSLPYYAMPRYIDIRTSLPLTEATGRVQKFALREEGVTPSMWDLETMGLTVERSQRR